METKKWYRSKITWLNIITFLVAVIPMAHDFLATTFNIQAGFLLVGVTGLTTILRLFFSNTDLTT